jgi:putative ATPase
MEKNSSQNSPLADVIRPQCLEEVFGQEELLGKDSFLRGAIKSDQVPSLIFWGPPGSGKTTLAFIIAKETQSDFLNLSAVSSGKKDLLKIIERARENKKIGRKTVLFIDEIHRWNKAQQDALLPQVENGTLILIGATTENPSFEVISALLSRARVFVLQRLEKEDLEKILKRALQKTQRKVKTEILKMIARFSNGDARMAINTLEACLNQKIEITEELVKKVLQKSHLLYDKSGEEHYNIISALHKSMRGGDADAAVYWLARMVEGGEDPLYIARRLVRFASEDVGLANNTALILANAVFDACHKLGYPECNVHLAQCVIYLTKSKKNIAAYQAYGEAKKDVEKWGNLPVPLHIRNAPTKLMKDLKYGKGYKYTPTEDSSNQEYFPKELKNRKYL